MHALVQHKPVASMSNDAFQPKTVAAKPVVASTEPLCNTAMRLLDQVTNLMRIRSIMLLAALLVVSACAEKGAGPVISAGDRYNPSTGTLADYRLDVGDRIKVTVYNEPNLSGDYGVGADGGVSLPLIGTVPASGHTVNEVISAARARYADGYLRQPKLSGEVSVFRPFFIIGEVGTPGSYPYIVGLTAMNAIATAKGFTPRANRDVVQIRKQGQTGEVNYRLTPELQIYPGDTIRVGERYF